MQVAESVVHNVYCMIACFATATFNTKAIWHPPIKVATLYHYQGLFQGGRPTCGSIVILLGLEPLRLDLSSFSCSTLFGDYFLPSLPLNPEIHNYDFVACHSA